MNNYDTSMEEGEMLEMFEFKTDKFKKLKPFGDNFDNLFDTSFVVTLTTLMCCEIG